MNPLSPSLPPSYSVVMWLTVIADLALTVVLIVALLKVSEGHGKIGEAMQDLRRFVVSRWGDGGGNPPDARSLAHSVLREEFLREHPQYRDEDEDSIETALAEWLTNRKPS